MKPAIGTIVHFWENGKENAALVVDVEDDGELTLVVFKRNGTNERVRDAQEAPGPKGETHRRWTRAKLEG